MCNIQHENLITRKVRNVTFFETFPNANPKEKNVDGHITSPLPEKVTSGPRVPTEMRPWLQSTAENIVLKNEKIKLVN